MHIRSVLITGANRGIGLEFVKQFLNLPSPPNIIFATCRSPEKAYDLQNLANSNPNVRIMQLDLTDESIFSKIHQQVEQGVREIGLNLLINNAALGLRVNLDNVTKADMMESFHVNAVSPLLLTKVLLPLLKKAASKIYDDSLSCARSAVINITSQRGSIEETVISGSYPYKTSKAALNIITKSLSVDLKAHGILVFALHPGRVLTAMASKDASITTTTSVSGMLYIIQQANEKNCGLMINYLGKPIPW